VAAAVAEASLMADEHLAGAEGAEGVPVSALVRPKWLQASATGGP
jgi:hypothetical protein